MQALLEDVHAELLELVTVNGTLTVLTIGYCLNRSSDSLRKISLGLHAQISEFVHGTLVVLDVDASLALEVIAAEFDKLVVDVLATEMGVTIGELNRDNSILDRDKGNI